MAKYTVIAYLPNEDGYPRKTAVIEAANKEEMGAQDKRALTLL